VLKSRKISEVHTFVGDEGNSSFAAIVRAFTHFIWCTTTEH